MKTMKRTIAPYIVGLAWPMALLAPGEAFACECAVHPPTASGLIAAPPPDRIAVIARVTEMRPGRGVGPDRTTFHVLRVLAGQAPRQMQMTVPFNHICGFPFEQGKVYAFFVNAGASGSFGTNGCAVPGQDMSQAGLLAAARR